MTPRQQFGGFFAGLIGLTGPAFADADADDPPSNADLRELIAGGRFHQVISTAVAAAAEPASDSPESARERRFLIELATDLARVARAEAAGAAQRPQGIRLRSIEGTSFAIFEKDTDLEEAKAIAASLGARLAEPRSQAQHDWIVGELLFPAAKRMGLRVMGLTGIENAGPGQIDTWHYTSDGAPIAFAAWHGGEPDGNKGEAVGAAFHTGDEGNWIDSNPGEGDGETYAKLPILEFPVLPRDPEAKPDLARTATAPLNPIAPFPNFDSLQKQAAGAVKARAIAPAESAFSKLIAGYRAALGREEQAATQRGNLEEVVALRNEKRAAEAIADLAAADALLRRPPPAHPGLAKMRENLGAAIEEIRASRADTIRPILSTYREALGDIEKQLTVEYRIADALAIRSLRNDLAEVLGQKREVVAAAPAARLSQTPPPGAGAAAVAANRKIELDIPERDWPRDSYDPGTPGKLGAFGSCGLVSDPQPIDLTRAQGIDDFVKVALLDGNRGGWLALRANGTLVSTDNNLNGTTGIWRMIPKCEDGAYLFHSNNTVTVDDYLPISYGGAPIPAREVAWISGGGYPAHLVTLKDGRVLLCGGGFVEKERKEIEDAFAGVKIHGSYRYGVHGVKENGEVVVAVLASADRMKKENGIRLPPVDNEDCRGVDFVDLRGASSKPIYLTEGGDVWGNEGDSSWFPKKFVKPVELGSGVDSRAKSRIVGIWNGAAVKVTLSRTGMWHVFGKFELDGGHLHGGLQDELNQRERVIRDLLVKTGDNEGEKFRAYALWIE